MRERKEIERREERKHKGGVKGRGGNFTPQLFLNVYAEKNAGERKCHRLSQRPIVNELTRS